MRIPTLYDAARVLSMSPGFQQFPGGGPHGKSQSRLTASPPSTTADIPGGSPFGFCEVSRSIDLFSITSVELTKQPIYIDDDFLVHIYGTFQDSFAPNATITVRADCGSHCEEYGAPPGERPGESISADFCEMSGIEQPLGGLETNVTCPPQEGHALISSPGYIMPMFFHAPGWYNFTVDAKTADGERIYCLTTEVCLRWEDEDKNKGYPPGPWTNCT
ncbi:hypothetical protein F4821DRAFT_24424 [Hypoxylon rubiginosum]|uniref:Uncharacterized protein n=1 Tax=Hypoxylon rubiginosum TaxID=110542 RepID=A0ACC0CMI1_9PEZI|nr:hypothetical protein F4821DRAFT_24424 [Hypoxylon rubiginosum]